MWRACCDSLPCASGLFCRNTLDGALCSIYRKGEEDGLHALWHCSNARSVWKQIEFYTILKSRQYGSFTDMCGWVFPLFNPLQQVRFALTAWSIWHWRNAIIRGSA